MAGKGSRPRIKKEPEAIVQNGSLNPEAYKETTGEVASNLTDILDKPTPADYKNHREYMKNVVGDKSFKPVKKSDMGIVKSSKQRRGRSRKPKHRGQYGIAA